MKQCAVCGSSMTADETVCRHCGRVQYGSACEKCGQPAPVLIRGSSVVCSGCGATRGPLSGVPVSMAGSAHRVGSVVATVLAWGIILGSIAVGGLVGAVVALVGAIAHVGVLYGVGLGVLLGALGGVAGALGLAGSRKLRERGDEVRDEALEQSILAMAGTRKGAVTTMEVSQNLSVTLVEADRLLTSMSRRGRASVEVNGEGILQYRFQDARGALAAMAQAHAQGNTGVRIDATVVAPPPNQSPAEVARDRVDREFEVMSERRRNGGV